MIKYSANHQEHAVSEDQDHGGMEERRNLPICPKILTKAEPVIQDLSTAARQTCSARSSVVSVGNWGAA